MIFSYFVVAAHRAARLAAPLAWRDRTTNPAPEFPRPDLHFIRSPAHHNRTTHHGAHQARQGKAPAPSPIEYRWELFSGSVTLLVTGCEGARRWPERKAQRPSATGLRAIFEGLGFQRGF